MSNVTDLYDKIGTILSSQLSSKTFIPNPFDIAGNSDNLLRDGYGYYIGAASLPDFDLPGFQGYSREFVIILTRDLYRTDNETDLLGSRQKSMFEDQNTIINSLANDRTLDNDIVRLEFTGDGGIESVFSGKFNFLQLISTFEVSYREETTYCYP